MLELEPPVFVDKGSTASTECSLSLALNLVSLEGQQEELLTRRRV
jgi:hypothetical protein